MIFPDLARLIWTFAGMNFVPATVIDSEMSASTLAFGAAAADEISESSCEPLVKFAWTVPPEDVEAMASYDPEELHLYGVLLDATNTIASAFWFGLHELGKVESQRIENESLIACAEAEKVNKLTNKTNRKIFSFIKTLRSNQY